MVLARQRYEEVAASVHRLFGAGHDIGLSRAATYGHVSS
jgi:hypothetical protein